MRDRRAWHSVAVSDLLVFVIPQECVLTPFKQIVPQVMERFEPEVAHLSAMVGGKDWSRACMVAHNDYREEGD